jgi:hypothetical protein
MLFIIIARFWYITLPITIILYFYFKNKNNKKQQEGYFDNLDPDKEIKINQDQK